MHTATPRTLLFLERDGLWLFLRGAPAKWFAGRLNGLGGSVERGEGVLAAAHRERVEATGLAAERLRLTAVVHTIEDPTVLLFVFTGTLPEGALAPTPEGEHVWLPAAALADPERPFVDDLRQLFPLVTAGGPPRSFTLRPPAELVDDEEATSRQARASLRGAGTREGGNEPMPEILNHCQQVPLAQPGPCEVDIQSAQGPGAVEVTGPNGAPVYDAVAVPPGGTVKVTAAGPLEVHYTQGAGGPPSIEAEIDQIPI